MWGIWPPDVTWEKSLKYFNLSWNLVSNCSKDLLDFCRTILNIWARSLSRFHQQLCVPAHQFDGVHTIFTLEINKDEKSKTEPWLLVDFFVRILFLGVWMRVYVHLSVIPKALILSQKKFTFKSWMEGNPYEKKCAKCRKWNGGKLNVNFSPFCGKLHSNWNIFLLKRKLGQKQIVPLQPESREERQKKSPSPTHLSCFDFKMH